MKQDPVPIAIQTQTGMRSTSQEKVRGGFTFGNIRLVMVGG